MGIKITKQIGTDRGITSEAYIRIVDYNFNKQGQANFRTELFLNKDVSKVPFGNQANNTEIGSNFTMTFVKDAEITTTTKRMAEVEKDVLVPNATDDTGNPIESYVKQKFMEEQDVEETRTVKVPDMEQLAGKDIFEIGYKGLKEKLVQLFQEKYITDF